MTLLINAKVAIPEKEIKWRFSRSASPGGQNTNKTETRVEIVFNVVESKSLSPSQKYRILIQKKFKLINGCICIAVQEKRSQYQNRQVALIRLSSMLRDLLKPPQKKRKKTLPTQLSQRKRLELKKKRGELKKNRQSNFLKFQQF